MIYRTVQLLSITLLLYSCTIRDRQPDSAPVKVDAYATAYNMISTGEELLKDGDLVVRSGLEFSSQFIKQMNRKDKSWSHSGIVFFENNHPFVYHMISGDENPDQKLRKDSLTRFCNPRTNSGYAIYRYDLSENELIKFRNAIYEWKAEGVRFDSTFNFATNDKMYCSEMIKKGLAKATANRIIIGTTTPTKNEAVFFSTHLHLPLDYTTHLKVVTVDNLFLNPNCQLIKRFDFNAKP